MTVQIARIWPNQEDSSELGAERRRGDRSGPFGHLVRWDGVRVLDSTCCDRMIHRQTSNRQAKWATLLAKGFRWRWMVCLNKTDKCRGAHSKLGKALLASTLGKSTDNFEKPYAVGFLGGTARDVFRELLKSRKTVDSVQFTETPGEATGIALRTCLLPTERLIALHVSLPNDIPLGESHEIQEMGFERYWESINVNCMLAVVIMLFLTHRVMVIQKSSFLDTSTASLLSKCSRIRRGLGQGFHAFSKFLWAGNEKDGGWTLGKSARGFPCFLLQVDQNESTQSPAHRYTIEAQTKGIIGNVSGRVIKSPSKTAWSLSPPSSAGSSGGRSFIRYRAQTESYETVLGALGLSSVDPTASRRLDAERANELPLLEFVLQWKPGHAEQGFLQPLDARRWAFWLFTLSSYLSISADSNTQESSRGEGADILLKTREEFHVIRAARALRQRDTLQMAIGSYQQDLPPIYNTKQHLTRLEKAKQCYKRMVWESNADTLGRSIADLVQECDRIWQDGRRRCDAISLTGKPCSLQYKHDTVRSRAVQHKSDAARLMACNCGRTRQFRTDPFDLVTANISGFHVAVCCSEKGVSETALPPHPAGGHSQWALLRLGHSSTYEPSCGLQQREGFMPKTNYLLQWNLSDFGSQQQTLLSGGSASIVRRSRGTSNPQRSGDSESHGKAWSTEGYIGFEYECERGHRFICSCDGKAASRGLEGVKDAGNDMLRKGMRLCVDCSTCQTVAQQNNSKPGGFAQLMRIYMVIPEGVRAFMPVLDPRVTAPGVSGAKDVCFDMGCPNKVTIPRNSFMVLRLPYVYESDGQVYLPSLNNGLRLERGFLSFEPRIAG